MIRRDQGSGTGVRSSGKGDTGAQSIKFFQGQWGTRHFSLTKYPYQYILGIEVMYVCCYDKFVI